MNKTIITTIATIAIVNALTLGPLYAATNSASTIPGLTKEQEIAIKKLIDKRVEQRINRLSYCLKNWCAKRDTSTGSALGEALWFCLEQEKL